MPSRAPSQCLEPGCGGLAYKGSRCAAHKGQADAARPNAAARGYCSARWKRLRLLVLHRDPLCVVCKQPATEADHVVPKADGGEDAMDNLQGLCKACHSSKTNREMGRGRGV